MSVALVNGHVLLPHAITWTTLPEWKRTWETDIAGAIIGSESRAGFRAHGRISLRYLVSPFDLQERARLEDRVRVALKSGFACCPYYGRASSLAVACINELVTITSDAWPWAIGDWMFFMNADRQWEVRQIEDVVDGVNITLTDVVSRTYAARLPVWPLLFGKLSEETMAAISAHHGDIPIAISELVSPASAQIGAYEPPDPPEDLAIPDMEIGDSFFVR